MAAKTQVVNEKARGLVVHYFEQLLVKNILPAVQKEYVKSIVGSKGTKNKTPKDPNAPTKNQSNYMYYLAANRSRIESEIGIKAAQKVAQECGRQWKRLPADEKDIWTQKAKEEKEKYLIVKAAYDAEKSKSSDEEVPKTKVVKKKSVKKSDASEKE
jgi:hypothetical protein